ncbi:MAG TPA: hypothetical protein VE990_13055 [Acidimicrobiales bacterium]|nr:hypothetical protein [Acidimicrobiales bacterium]
MDTRCRHARGNRRKRGRRWCFTEGGQQLADHQPGVEGPDGHTGFDSGGRDQLGGHAADDGLGRGQPLGGGAHHAVDNGQCHSKDLLFGIPMDDDRQVAV